MSNHIDSQDTMPSKKFLTFVILSLTLAIFLMSLLEDVDFVNVEDELYCEMTELWVEQAHIAPELREGWPPYKGACPLEVGKNR